MKLKIEDILFIIFFMLAVVFSFWFLLGKSPTLEQSLLVVIIGSLIGLNSVILKLYGEIRELKSKFEMIWDDFKKRKKM